MQTFQLHVSLQTSAIGLWAAATMRGPKRRPPITLRELRSVPLRELRDAAAREVKWRAARATGNLRERRQKAAAAVRSKLAKERPQPKKSTRSQQPSFGTRVLAWEPTLIYQHECRDGGQSILRMSHQSSMEPWAAGSLLTTGGRSAFTVHLHVASGAVGASSCCIGVCDADNQNAWGLHVRSGRLFRCMRDASSGCVSNGMSPPPPGYPDGHGTRVVSEAAVAAAPDGTGATISVTCLVDASARTLSIGVGSHEPTLALRNLPLNVALRPWARLAMPHDRANIEACSYAGMTPGSGGQWLALCVDRSGHRTQVV